ncbi:ABC transporter permease, partial [Sinorhizobium meliloti]
MEADIVEIPVFFQRLDVILLSPLRRSAWGGGKSAGRETP